MSQEKSKTMSMQIFLGVKQLYYGIVQVENCIGCDGGRGWVGGG